MTTNPASPRLLEALRDPKARVFVLTGAGISAAAGIRTYRGEDGLYPSGQLIPLYGRDAKSRTVHELWQKLDDVRVAAANASPTSAHLLLARLQEEGRDLTVATQNIDGLHTRAGGRAAELHGNLLLARCLNPKCQRQVPAPTGPAPAGPDDVARCPHDGARLRPDVVLFNEMLNKRVVDETEALAKSADVVLAVGTSLQVTPAAGFVYDALAAGAVGAWLDRDPDTMWRELPFASHQAFKALERIPGDCQETLPNLFGRP